MIGLGTLINATAVIVGGLIGLWLNKGLAQRFQDTITQAQGLAVVFIGISGTLSQMFVESRGTLDTQGTMMMVISLVLGAVIGEWFNLELYIENFGNFLKSKISSKNDSRFVDGFVTASLTVCIGAMSVVGSLQDGMSGDYTMLATKAILDGVIIVIFAASYGVGAIFSVIPLVIFQGSITLLARLIEPWLNATAISNLSLVGSTLILCVGLNIMFNTKIKVANLLPALVFATLAGIIFK
ncbi:DUF554 domain-containing protein [Lactococcus sp.]|uniref:DUF554 domain-containing protein n=1 Tax=Lactococcus sp. TaxID=44273 RepID=UPI0035B47265